MGLLTITILGTAVGTLVALEAKSWMSYLSAKLVRSTLDTMPAELDGEIRSRWREEVEGDLDSYADRPFAGLLFSLRLRRRGGRRLAAELMLDHVLSNGEDPFELPRPATRIMARFDRKSEVVAYEDDVGNLIHEHHLFPGAIVKDPVTNERLRNGERVVIALVSPPERSEGAP